MVINIKEKLVNLFENWSREKAIIFFALPPSGSSRKYFRIQSKNKTALGVFYPHRKENLAFLGFTKHFLEKKLRVPKIYLEDSDKSFYLIQDLGDETVFSFLNKQRKNGEFPPVVKNIYKKILKDLIIFQTIGGRGLNYKLCSPRDKFDHQSMLWDLNYFKYYFLKLAKINFDEQKLEKGFQKFIDFLLQADCSFFLYRDFQSRNIMLYKNKPYFIDYQGGRQGALQYDLASLIFDAKADLPIPVRNDLIKYYFKNLTQSSSSTGKQSIEKKVDEKSFLRYFYGYALIRILQAMGSYGFRGFYERKEHFLQSIPYALKNLEYVINQADLPKSTNYLIAILKKVIESPALKTFETIKNDTLIVRINSFSYKSGLPLDGSGNGGGFIFDCRLLTNPGKIEKYKNLNGNDQSVIDFFKKKKEADEFMKNVFSLVNQAVKKYKKRNFNDLMINFGCTGGQHRSIFCANKLVEYLKTKGIKTIVRHLEQEKKLL